MTQGTHRTYPLHFFLSFSFFFLGFLSLQQPWLLKGARAEAVWGAERGREEGRRGGVAWGAHRLRKGQRSRRLGCSAWASCRRRRRGNRAMAMLWWFRDACGGPGSLDGRRGSSM